jgi:NSS family neurotransmitter:Na+ symporter
MTDPNRGSWGSGGGFVLAAAGSAVGLGNIWKFPYMAGQNGGAAFIIVYLGIIFTVGFSVMLAEIVIGRAAGRNPVGAFRSLKGGAWPVLGYIGVIGATVILGFYSVVGGWTLAYVWIMATDGIAAANAGQVFDGFVSDAGRPILFHGLFMAATVAVVVGGVRGGIERCCRILFPALFLILLALIARSLTLPGALKGLEFFLAPDFSKITPAVLNAALSQAFFTLALGAGAMLTYGSYLSRKISVTRAAFWVTALDTGVALLAGLAILPAVFAFGFDPAEGPGLSFVTLPAVFAMMPGGAFFGVLFFIMLALAALTSALSLLEVFVAYFVDEFGLSRRRVTIGGGLVAFALGVPASLSFGAWSGVEIFGANIFDAMNLLTINFLLPIGGIGMAVFVGWAIWPRAAAELPHQDGPIPRWAPLWRLVCAIVAPALILVILISGL